jgi:hypothetical protein
MMTFRLRKSGDLFGCLLRRQIVTKLLKQTSNNRAVADGRRTNANIFLHAEVRAALSDSFLSAKENASR